MGKYKGMLVALLSVLMLMTACAAEKTFTAPPLYEPKGAYMDTYKVTARAFGDTKQYKGYVKFETTELFFTKADFPVKQVYCFPGQQIKAGDVIMRLDTKDLEEEIEKQQEKMEDLRVSFDLQNNVTACDVELAALALSEATDDQSRQLRQLELKQVELRLTQDMQSQRMEMGFEQQNLDKMLERLAETVLVAPFDGIIMQMDEVTGGSWVTPYKPIVYFSDGKAVVVEYSGSDYINVSESDIVEGVIDGELFPLTYRPIPQEKRVAYMLEYKTVPFQFVFSDEALNTNGTKFAGRNIAINVTKVRKENALVVPVNAMFSDPSVGSYVYIIEDGQKVLRQVEVGIKNEAFIEIKSGLSEGDEVFVKQ